MNERIQKLAEQAEEWVCKNCPNAMDDSDEFYSQTTAKFAELIVRECAEFANLHNEEVEGVTLGVGPALKKHFGVEE